MGFTRDYYGAIYVDETTGIAGVVVNHETNDSAKKAALAQCKKKSGKKYCEFISGWANSCSAAAWSPKNKSARRGDLSDNQKWVEKEAIAACKRAEGDRKCELVATACTSWEVYEEITIWGP